MSEDAAPARFYLAADVENRTYWTLLLRADTTAADVLNQIGSKMQVDPATLSLSSAVREESGDLLRKSALWGAPSQPWLNARATHTPRRRADCGRRARGGS